MLHLYLSKQRSTFLPLLNSIAAFMLAPMWERQADRSTVNPIVLLYLLALDENQEVSKATGVRLSARRDRRVIIIIYEIMFVFWARTSKKKKRCS